MLSWRTPALLPHGSKRGSSQNGRSFVWRDWSDEYRLTVVEVLLQRTRAETVARFAPTFFEAFPDWPTLAGQPATSLEVTLAPIGLSHRRADVLHWLAVHMANRTVPVTVEAPGGQRRSTSAGPSLSWGEERAAMVDSNWVRVYPGVFEGSWMADYRYDPRLQALSQAIVDGGRDARAVNWAMLDLGATICLPRRPRCDACPLAATCAYRAAAR